MRDLDHYTEKISTLQRADEADKPLQSATSGTSTIPGRCQSRRENLRTNVGAPASYDDNGYHAGASIRAGGSVVEFVEEREAQVDKIFTVSNLSCSEGEPRTRPAHLCVLSRCRTD